MSNQTQNCMVCGIQTFRRNTYFNGKLLVERDFIDEQAYLVGKDRLHNSLLHGVGTVCGLKVLAHPNPECQDRYVYIEPGVALDCCGREIVVTQKQLVSIEDLLDPETADAEGTKDLFIALCYDETMEEKIPVILPDCDCADGNQAYNRIREGYKVTLFTREAGETEAARPPLRARLDWEHTITLAHRSPRAVAVDDELQQLYVAAQRIPDDEGGARLLAYRTDNHDLITDVNGGVNPTDLGLSLLGDLIFLATGGLDTGGGPNVSGIAVFIEADIRSSSAPAAIIDLGSSARLTVSPKTGDLFALDLSNGRVTRWADADLRTWLQDPTPNPSGPAVTWTVELGHAFDQADSPALRGVSILSVTLDGRYLFIADEQTTQIRVIDVATGGEVTPALTAEGTTLALNASRDSAYLYVLWSEAGDSSDQTLLKRYRIDTASGFNLVADGRGGIWSAAARDLALAPNERWAYILQESAEGQGQVQSIDVEVVGGPGSDPDDGDDPASNLLGTRENTAGSVRYQRLAIQGGRLYVAAEDEATLLQPDRGLVAILNVEEADCGDKFTNILDSCPACADDEDGDSHCIILAHVPKYKLDEPIKDAADAAEGENGIDNLTHRPLVPSTNNIVEVVRCMLEQGFAEGVPGPRGAAGVQGLPGDQGERGASIVEVALAEPGPNPGQPPTVSIEPVDPADPDGDFRLILGIPPGADGEDGDDGERGPGVTAVQVTTLNPGQNATASLTPIPGDPEGDFRLDLGIPRGAPGEPEELDLTRIERISWQHGQPFKASDLIDPAALDEGVFDDDSVLHPPGLVLAFNRKVDVPTILTGIDTPTGQPPIWTNSEVFQLYVRREEISGEGEGRIRRYCECRLPDVVYQPVRVLNEQGDIQEVVTLDPRTGDPAQAVRIVFDNEQLLNNILNEFVIVNQRMQTAEVFFRVVFRADFAMDVESEPNAVDGNHIGGLVPTGNGRPGNTFESWFTIEITG